MAEEIEVGNVGGATGVASEVTLVRLVAAMEKMAGSEGVDPKKLNALLKEQYKLIQDANSEEQKNTKEKEKGRKQLNKFTDGVKSAARAITAMSGAITGQLMGSVVGLTKAFTGTETSLASFAKTLPFVGSIAGELAGVIDTNIDAFRALSTVGATFGNGLTDPRIQAANAAMPLDMFVGIINENAQAMQFFGGSTAAGGAQFARMSKQFRDGPGKSLMAIGYSVSDLNDLMLDYAEYQQMQFGIDRRNANISQQDLKEYGEEMQRLSAVTGLQRKAIQDELNAKMEDVRNQQAISLMSDAQQKNYRAATAVAASIGPQMSEAITDMVDGIPSKGSIAEGLMVASKTFAAEAGNLKNMTLEQQQDFFARVKTEVGDKATSLGDSLQAVLNGNSSYAEALKLNTGLQKFEIKSKEDLKKINDQLIAEANRDTALKTFQQTILDLRSVFDKIFFAEGGPFNTMTTGFQGLAAFFATEEGKESFKTALEKVADAFTRVYNSIEMFIKDFAEFDLRTAIMGGKKDDEYGAVREDGTRAKLTRDVSGLFGGAGGDMGLGKILGEAIGVAIKMLIGDIKWDTVAFAGGVGAAGLAAMMLLPLTGPIGIGILGALGAATAIWATKDKWMPYVNDMADTVKGWGTAISDGWNAGKTNVKQAWTDTKDGINAIGTTIATTWDDTKESISAKWTTAKDNVVAIGTSIANTWDDTKESISAKWTTAKNNIVAIGTSIADTWDDTKEAISTKWLQAKTLVSNIAGKIKTAWEDGTITAKYNSAKTFLSDVGSKLGTAFSDIDWDKYSIKSQFGKVWDAITGFFTFDFTMPNFRDFLPTWLGGKGKEIGDTGNLPPDQKTHSSMPDTSGATSKAGMLEDAKQAINTIIDIPNLKSALAAIKSGFDANRVETYATALESVAQQLERINEAGKDQETTIQSRRGTKTVNQESAAAKVLNNPDSFQNPGSASLATLNSTMLLVLKELQGQTPHVKRAGSGLNVAQNVTLPLGGN